MSQFTFDDVHDIQTRVSTQVQNDVDIPNEYLQEILEVVIPFAKQTMSFEQAGEQLTQTLLNLMKSIHEKDNVWVHLHYHKMFRAVSNNDNVVSACYGFLLKLLKNA